MPRRLVEANAFCLANVLCPYHQFEEGKTVFNKEMGMDELKYEIYCPFDTCKWFPDQLSPPCTLTQKRMDEVEGRVKKPRKRKRQPQKKPRKRKRQDLTQFFNEG